MTHSAQPNLTKARLYATVLAIAAVPLFGVPAMGQYTASTGPTTGYMTNQSSAAGNGVTGSVPSGPATSEMLLWVYATPSPELRATTWRR